MVFNTYIQATTENGISAAPDILFPGNECPPEVLNNTPAHHCAAVSDGLLCWPATLANTTAVLRCPPFAEITNTTLARAYRHCPANATWKDAISDYSECMVLLPEQSTEDPSLAEEIRMAELLRDLYFILSTISLVLLFITFCIFQYFRSLQCSRITIHKNLVVSFLLRFIVNIVIVEPYISHRETSYRDFDWLCKTVTALLQYATLANMFWMFVEGLFLHHSLVVGVFSTDPNFLLFYLIGWGAPAVFILAWVLTLHFVHDTPCWADYSQLPYYYIITVPFILALAINLVFLVNIIRVLVSKLRANNRIESANIRKAIKATVVLLPLLGLTNLIFFMNPGESPGFKTAYRVTNAVLTSSQGIFVAILYCFMNGEVLLLHCCNWWKAQKYVFKQDADTNGPDRATNHVGAEHLRLLQANMALKNETVDPPNHIDSNGGLWMNSNNNFTSRNSRKDSNGYQIDFEGFGGVDKSRETIL